MRWKWMTIGVAAACLAFAPAAQADTFTVSGTADGTGSCTAGSCTTIRAALTAAAVTPQDPDTIVLPAGAYQLQDGALAIDSPVTLTGADARTTSIVAGGTTRALTITAAASVSHLTIRGGTAAGDVGGNILSQGATVALDHVRVTGGSASTGAGIANRVGTMTITNSLIDGNHATIAGGTGDTLEAAGGGLVNLGDALGTASLTLRNSTVALNDARLGGGIVNAGAELNAVTLQNVTLAGNQAGDRGAAGLSNQTGRFELARSIVANNTLVGGGEANCAGAAVVSMTYNVSSGADCAFGDPTDRNSVAAGLSGDLADRGGETPTLDIAATSPAVDLIPSAQCPAADQRDVARPQGPACDAGAVERTSVPIVIDSGPSGPIKGPSATFAFTASGDAECRLVTPQTGDPAYAPCTSPVTYNDLTTEGAYTFQVTPAVTHDPALSASRAFSIDTTAPAVEITSAPSSPTKQAAISIAFTSPEQGVTFECSHTAPNGTPASGPCTSPWNLEVSGDGDHRFSIVAIDAAGNRGAPAERTIKLDTVAPDPPAITSPLDGAVLGGTFTVTGTAPDAASVQVFVNGVARGSAEVSAGAWQFPIDGLKDGTYAITATATDAAGNTSPASAARTVRVDTVEPTVSITASPASPTNATSATITFTGSEPDTTFTCRIQPPGSGNPLPAEPCESPWTIPDLVEGEYRFEVSARDARFDGPYAGVTVLVDRTAPAAVVASQPDATTFTFAGAESGASFQCRLEGPNGDSGFAACTSPKRYPDLKPGDYRFTLRTFDAAGNHADAAPKTFSIAATPEATPTPVADSTPAPAPVPLEVAPPTPTPQSGESVVVRPADGTILVRLPGTTEFVAISRSRAIPLGSEVDARKGKVVLTAEPADGRPVERATFYAGLFTVQQAGGYVEVTLGEELAPCKKKKASAAAAKPKSRKLWGDGKGHFRTKGQASVATVRGTKWLVEDSCDGTLTRVAQGVVSVRDIPKRKTVLLRAGRSYLAKPKK